IFNAQNLRKVGNFHHAPTSTVNLTLQTVSRGLTPRRKPTIGIDTWLVHGHGIYQVFCRIDYQIATPGIAAKARAASIYKDARFSDHAPLTVDYDYTLT
ncbi:MAG TPA: hypothetical protein PLW81_14555, partial [Thiobacillaceae bacterium]|nr:hypothetical protein [Thiobacillaceae bacterium]